MPRRAPEFTSITIPVPPLAASNLLSMDSMPFSRAIWTLMSRVSTRSLPFSASKYCSYWNSRGWPLLFLAEMVLPAVPERSSLYLTSRPTAPLLSMSTKPRTLAAMAL